MDLVRFNRPADVVRRPLPQRLPTVAETVVGTNRQISAEILRLKRARLLVSTGERRLVTRGPYAGQVELELVVLDRPAPVWPRRCLIAGWVMMGFSAVVTSLTWLLTSLTSAALITVLVSVLATFLGGLWIRFGGGRSRNVIVNQVVQMR
jgi:hypothetical protein